MDAPSPVIIVGGGPVGLASALELARFGVPSVVLEQRETTSWHPRTRNVNTRTMEIARGWGMPVYDQLRAIDTPPGWKSPIRFLRSLVGEQLGEIETKGFEGPGSDVSPALPVMSSQDLVEKILLEAARATGLADLRFRTRLLALTSGASEGDREVSVDVLDDATGREYRLLGSSLVAADGADSGIREQLDIPLEGPRDIAHFINCYFRADLERYVGERKGVLFFISNERASGVLQPLDACGRWLCQIVVRKEDWDPAVFTLDRCATWIRDAAGVEDLAPEILSVGRWRMNASVAKTFLSGRVVLVGDAAHQFPPTGGLGVNTGIQGMHNVIWKLALYINGEAGRPLLGTYNDERQPVSRWTAEQSLHNSQQVALIGSAALARRAHGIDAADVVTATRRYGNHLGLEFGSWYESGAVIPDGTAPPEADDPYSDYSPCARPGHRAPHVWLGRGNARVSTIDLFGSGFTLLTGHQKAASDFMTQVSKGQGVPVTAHTVGAPGLEDVDGRFFELYGIDRDGVVLVRPDGYVAWRSATAASAQAVGEAFASILAGGKPG